MTVLADYHIHLHHSPCTAKEMTAAAALSVAAACNLAEAGLVNHLHPGTDSDVFRQSRSEIDEYDGPRPPKVLLGAEVDLLDQDGNTSFRQEVADLVDFVTLAPGHQQLEWVSCDLSVPAAQFLERETRAIITALRKHHFHALVHPFIYVAFPKVAPHYVETLRPGELPEELMDELAETLCAGGTAFEYHCRDMVIRPERLGGEPFMTSYMRLLDAMRARGVRFVTGSDAHRLDQISRSAAAPDWARAPLLTLRQRRIPQ